MNRIARTWVAVAAVATAVGCSTTIDGTATTARGAGGWHGVVVALLDVGNYPATPRPPLGVAGAPREGGWAEARRLATNVAGPWEVDPALTQYAQVDTGPVKASEG